MAQSKAARLKERSHRKAWQKRRPSQRHILPPSIHNTEDLGLPKVSDRLMKLVEEFDEVCEVDRAYDTLLAIGVIAWNASLAAPNERELALIDMLISTSPRLDDAIRAAAAEDAENPAEFPLDRIDPQLRKDLAMGFALGLKFLHRKLELFPNDTRAIRDFWFEYAPERNERILKVMSTFPPDSKPS